MKFWEDYKRGVRLKAAREEITRVANQNWMPCKELKLCSMDLDAEDLEILIPEIKKIRGLYKLDLSYNKLTTIPDSLAELNTLTDLHITNNQIVSIPDSLAKLSNLKDLWLYDNQLQTLPDNFGELKKLESIHLSKNQLEKLPDSIVDLPVLRFLSLDHNKLQTLPNNLGRLSAMECLCLMDNKLSTLPDSLGQLKKLFHLYINDNQITRLPDSLGELSSLGYIFAQNNQLQTMPESYGNLEALIELNLENNQLRTLPENNLKLSRRGKLNLMNNLNMDSAVVRRLRRHYIVASEYKKSLTEDRICRFLGREIDNYPKNTSELGEFVIKDRLYNVDKVLEAFLKAIPREDVYSDSVYLPAAKSLIENVVRDQLSPKERQNILHQMASALGDCATPVKSLLTQTYVGLHQNAAHGIPKEACDLIQGMAIEKAILKKFKFGSTHEGIEKTQALLNSLLFQGSERHLYNKVKIIGKEMYRPSLTINMDYGYGLIDEATAQEFAKMVCKTHPDTGALLKSSNAYICDPKKVRVITEPYFAQLGFVSIREQAVAEFKKNFERILREKKELCINYFRIPEVEEFISTIPRIEEFRTFLQSVPEDQIEAAVTQILSEKEQKATSLWEKYSDIFDSQHASGLDRMTTASCDLLSKLGQRSFDSDSESSESVDQENDVARRVRRYQPSF